MAQEAGNLARAQAAKLRTATPTGQTVVASRRGNRPARAIDAEIGKATPIFSPEKGEVGAGSAPGLPCRSCAAAKAEWGSVAIRQFRLLEQLAALDRAAAQQRRSPLGKSVRA